MKKLIIAILTLSTALVSYSQNVGIGTTTPSEKLDVNGSIKTTGELKPNGVAGQSGQVLTSNGNGTMQWSSATASSNYTNIGGFGSWGGCEINNITDMYPVSDSAGNGNDYFGKAVAMSGDYAVIGANNADVGAVNGAGTATVFKRNSITGAWEKQVVLSEASPSGLDNFGYSVAISGDYIVVGAPDDDNSSLVDNGAIYIYKRDPATGTWPLKVKLFGQSAQAGDHFGFSVAINSDHIAIGIPGYDEVGNTNMGAVAVYKRNMAFDTWELLQKLKDFAPVAGAQFGYSVSMSPGHLIIGAPFDIESPATQPNGSASLFKRNTLTGFFQLDISLVGEQLGAEFGYAVSVSGSYAVVSAPKFAFGGCTSCGMGKVYLYTRNASGTWSSPFFLNKADGTDGGFGSSVCVSGDYLIVGDREINNRRGDAFIYKRLNALWVLMQRFRSPYPTGSYQDFGNAVAIDGVTQRFLVGAPEVFSKGMCFFGKVN